MSRPVLVAAGGTGGHVIPALAVADVLAQRNIPVIWMGTSSGLEARLVPAAGIDIRCISVVGLRGKTALQTLIAPLKLLRACVQCVHLVYSLKPRAVLGMGGFVSGPVGIAALLARKPLVLHEQNAIAGMTNRWLSAHAQRVLCAWSGVFKESINARSVGNPVSADIAELAAKSCAADTNASERASRHSLRVLVVGGSRGAQVLNEIVPEAIAALEQPVSVLHQAGVSNVESVEKRYRQATQADVTVSEFIDDMAGAYQAADVVISRSGAMTITELSALGVPSILVPFPSAVDDHQTYNAKHLSDVGAAVLMPQSSLTALTLSSELKRLISAPEELAAMARAARSCFTPRAAEAVADALIEVSR